MATFFDQNYLLYLLLLISVVACRFSSIRVSLILFAVTTVIALILRRLEPLGLAYLLITGLSLWTVTHFYMSRWLRWIGFTVFLILAFAMSNHLLPGFNNLLVFDRIQFSSGSKPFSMYLNFDKTSIGIFIFLLLLKNQNKTSWHRIHLGFSIKVLALLLVIMLPIAILSEYVKLDLKWPPETGLWALNNFFFVAFAEEALFRGMIQGGLTKITPKSLVWKWVPLIIASLLFGLAHYRGGIPYILLALVAGLFYGYTYQKTNSLESAMFVHFGLNLIHFLFFSYPSLQS